MCFSLVYFNTNNLQNPQKEKMMEEFFDLIASIYAIQRGVKAFIGTPFILTYIFFDKKREKKKKLREYQRQQQEVIYREEMERERRRIEEENRIRSEEERKEKMKRAFECNEKIISLKICEIANTYLPTKEYELFFEKGLTNIERRSGDYIDGYFDFPCFPSMLKIYFQFKVNWDETIQESENTIILCGNDFAYFCDSLEEDAFIKLFKGHMSVYEEEKKNAIGKEFVMLPYEKYRYFINCPEEIINWYEHMTTNQDKHPERISKKSKNPDNYGTLCFKEKLKMPFIPGSYHDKNGIYLTKFNSTDFYKHTKKVIDRRTIDSLIAGDYGEYIIPRKLFFEYKGITRLLWNVYIPGDVKEEEKIRDYYKYKEIDAIALTQMGIFVVECKNWSKTSSFRNVLGDWYYLDDYYMKEKTFYSPVAQNNLHVDVLRKFLEDNNKGENITVYNIVCFMDKETDILTPSCQEGMDEYECSQEAFFFGKVEEVSEKIKKLYGENCLDREQIDSLYELLYPKTQFSEEKKKQIIEKNKRNNME